jgi:hypothetical protein
MKDQSLTNVMWYNDIQNDRWQDGKMITVRSIEFAADSRILTKENKS